MAQTEYLIRQEGGSAFLVEIREPGLPVAFQGPFGSEALAQDFIRDQRRLAAIGDRVENSRIGRIHRRDK
jgi:hypothetical protein